MKKTLSEIFMLSEDPARTGRFYQRLLGEKPKEVSADNFVLVHDGIYYWIHSPHGMLSPAADHLVLEVTDLDEACKDLKSEGYAVDEAPKSYPWGLCAYLKDPDGRWLELKQKARKEAK